MKKKILLSIIILTVAFSAGIALKTKAGTGDSGTGWLWGGSDDGAGNSTGISWISMNDTNTGMGSYGINIPAAGNVTGYAWSGGGDDGMGVGWIDFESQNHCIVAPALPGPSQYQAASCTNPDGGLVGVSRAGDTLVGWARIVGIAQASVTGNSGGWEGWIKMSGTAQDSKPYGVTIENDGSFCKAGDLTTFQVAGDGLRHCAAWSGGVASAELGFIDFRQASIGAAAKTLKICENACDSGIMRAIESVPGNLSVTEGAPARNLKVCYNNAIDCSDASGNMTADINTSWTETAVTGDAFSLSAPGTDPKIMSFNAVAASTTENLSVTYSDAGTPHTANFDVTVTNICSCKACDASDNCVDTAYTGASCPCSDSCTVVPNSCVSSDTGPNWKEVAP